VTNSQCTMHNWLLRLFITGILLSIVLVTAPAEAALCPLCPWDKVPRAWDKVPGAPPVQQGPWSCGTVLDRPGSFGPRTKGTVQCPRTQGDNLLRNPDFEEGFSQRGAGEMIVAHRWEPWWVQGTDDQIKEGYFYRPEYKPESAALFGRRRIHSSDYAQKLFTPMPPTRPGCTSKSAASRLARRSPSLPGFRCGAAARTTPAGATSLGTTNHGSALTRPAGGMQRLTRLSGQSRRWPATGGCACRWPP